MMIIVPYIKCIFSDSLKIFSFIIGFGLSVYDAPKWGYLNIVYQGSFNILDPWDAGFTFQLTLWIVLHQWIMTFFIPNNAFFFALVLQPCWHFPILSLPMSFNL